MSKIMSDMENDPIQKTITALREPDPSLARVPNTIRQSIADIIQMQAGRIDSYGLALRMIVAGCDDPRGVAARFLAKDYPSPARAR